MRKLALAILIALLIAPIAHADNIQPSKDYSQLTPDGQYIFVMLYKDIIDGYNPYRIEPDPELRATYPHSGLYSAHNPKQLIYSVDWNANQINLSHNGEYLIRWGPLAAAPNYEVMALEFYHNGQLSKSYAVSDLTRRYNKLPNRTNYYDWLADYTFEPNTNTISLNLISGEHYLIDITNGQIIEQHKGIEPAPILLTLLPILAIILGLFWREHKTLAS
jgi:hypothetical protein